MLSCFVIPKKKSLTRQFRRWRLFFTTLVSFYVIFLHILWNYIIFSKPCSHTNKQTWSLLLRTDHQKKAQKRTFFFVFEFRNKFVGTIRNNHKIIKKKKVPRHIFYVFFFVNLLGFLISSLKAKVKEHKTSNKTLNKGKLQKTTTQKNVKNFLIILRTLLLQHKFLWYIFLRSHLWNRKKKMTKNERKVIFWWYFLSGHDDFYGQPKKKQEEIYVFALFFCIIM